MISTIQSLLNDYKQDPSLESSLDMNEVLKAVENTKHDFLDNKTLDSISQEKMEVIQSLETPKKIKKEYFDKLAEYMFVDEIHELQRGKYIRWIRKINPGVITNGGILVDIKFLDKGTYIVIKPPSMPRFIQYKFDDCFTFQKLGYEEQLILTAYEFSK
jgi:hypothetical protein